MNSMLSLLVSVGIHVGGGILMGLLTRKNIETWFDLHLIWKHWEIHRYKTLKRPKLAPPNKVFGPVWTTLYLMMATSVWLIYSDGGFAKHPFEITVYMIQLFLNFMWTPLFFGLHVLAISLVEICLMWMTILYTIILFYPINPIAAYLLCPYLLWVSFATYLNYGYWNLNGHSK